MKVLIIGGGIVGLTIAQGCHENGIPYELFERDTEGIVYPPPIERFEYGCGLMFFFEQEAAVRDGH